MQLNEQTIKAGLVYNFLKYTTWPGQDQKDGGDKRHLEVCLLGVSPTDSYLAPLAGQTAQQLVIDLVRKSRVDLLVAERKLLERVAGWCAYPAVLCGNTIGQDKRFVDQWMPGLSGYLSYRTIDVTSIKLLTKAWYGEEAVFDKPVKGEHDALVDIKNSIAELSHYRATVFKTP